MGGGLRPDRMSTGERGCSKRDKCGQGGEGVKKSEIFMDVIDGCPLKSVATLARL